MNLVDEVKKKREFSGLPNSVVERALGLSEGDVKNTRALLRKYFGVFLTNRVLKGKGGLLVVHMSSKKRDYQKFYSKIFEVVRGCERRGEDFDDCRHRGVGSVVDLGCGVNGFSYEYLPRGVSYIGVEAVGQLVDLTNDYFDEKGYDGRVLHGDLFDVGFVKKILKDAGKPRVVFMFQIVDALENLERDFSKRFILEVAKECEWIVLTLPTESLGGRKKFAVRRKWIVDFLRENFLVEESLVARGEKMIILKNKK